MVICGREYHGNLVKGAHTFLINNIILYANFQPF